MVAPGSEFLGKCPKVPMATVVDAFMSAIEDDSRHGMGRTRYGVQILRLYLIRSL